MSKIEHVVYDKEMSDYTKCVIKKDDFPQYFTEVESPKITKICYNVGDECVFEITKGKKKWTIPLDDFFDKIIQTCAESNE